MTHMQCGKQWNQGLAIGVFVGLFTLSSFAFCQQQNAHPTISDKPLSAEQLEIYAAVLRGWMNDGKHTLHLADLTIPLDKEDTKDCGKFPPADINSVTVHRFRQQDIASLGSSMIRLVDPEVQSREIQRNDPGKAIQNGTSVDEAVENGYAHGLVTLSEIRFDQSHTHAIVWYGFRCGGLCGNGGTVLMEKKDGKWREEKSCSIWMSKRQMTPGLPFAEGS